MIRRNVASQTVYFPQLQLVADGSAVTSSATLTVSKDGSESVSAGTLTHSANGVWKYTLTQSETDAAIVGLVLTASGAVPVVLNLVTTAANPQDAAGFGLSRIDATMGSRSTLDADGVRAALGLASANLDTQLSDLPTVAEFSARTLPSADYFVVSDYTAPDATKLIDVWKRLGLDPANPLVNTATLISAGATLQIDVTQTSTTVTTTRQA